MIKSSTRKLKRGIYCSHEDRYYIQNQHISYSKKRKTIKNKRHGLSR